jgi:uncharacterized protein (TIGR02217 family)
MTAAFHEALFPLDIALKSAGGPERRTEIVALGSGREERNARWAHSRRRFDAGYGVKTFEALSAVVALFEERRGRLHGFRWRDRLDYKSGAPEAGAGIALSTGSSRYDAQDIIERLCAERMAFLKSLKNWSRR